MPPNQPAGMPQMQPGQPPYQPLPGAPLQSKPKKHFNVLIIPLIFLALFLIGALVFGFWAYGERNTYKDETQEIVNKEVTAAKQQVATAKDAEFVEKEKRPFKVYKGPSTFGSVEFEYPKTWAAFITESANNTPIDGYLHPDFVPGTKSGTSFALRVELVQRNYDAEMKQFESKVRQGKVSVAPFRAELVPGVLGSRVEGEVNAGQKDIMVLFPIRDNTLKISTESETFFKDFNEIILKTLKFSP